MVVLVHSFYDWDKDKIGDHLTSSFKQFIDSSHSSVIVSAVERAVQSCGDNEGSLCEKLIQIVLENLLGSVYIWLVYFLFIYLLQSILL